MKQKEKENQQQLWIARLCEPEESGMTQEEWCKRITFPIAPSGIG